MGQSHHAAFYISTEERKRNIVLDVMGALSGLFFFLLVFFQGEINHYTVQQTGLTFIILLVVLANHFSPMTDLTITVFNKKIEPIRSKSPFVPRSYKYYLMTNYGDQKIEADREIYALVNKGETIEVKGKKWFGNRIIGIKRHVVGTADALEKLSAEENAIIVSRFGLPWEVGLIFGAVLIGLYVVFVLSSILT